MTHTKTTAGPSETTMNTTPEPNYTILWTTRPKGLIWFDGEFSGAPVVAEAHKECFKIRGGTDPFEAYGRVAPELFAQAIAAHEAIAAGEDLAHMATHRLGDRGKGEPHFVPLTEAQTQP